MRPAWERVGRSLKVAAGAAVGSMLWPPLAAYAGNAWVSDDVFIASMLLLPILFLFGGGAFVIWHYLARLVLSIRGRGPLRYGQFLEVAVDRLLLREAGGHYQFVHGLLREHLADDERPRQPIVGPGVSGRASPRAVPNPDTATAASA